MNSSTYIGNLQEEVANAYEKLFKNQWPVMVAGVGIAVLALMIFLWQGPWGIAAGYRNWGEWILYAIGVSAVKPELPWLHSISVTNLGLLIGAFASALLSGQFAFRTTTGREYVKALIGGVLMGFGATLSKGCNVGGFYSAVGVFSIGGYAMMAGLGIGAYLGLRILMWELNTLPPAATSQIKVNGKKVPVVNWEKIKPWAGGLILILSVAAFAIYSLYEKTTLGGLMFFGVLIGVTMHRARFCFVRAFRCPLMTGESEMVKVVALSLAIYGAGSAVIKWNYLQPDTMGVHHPFIWGSLVGGGIFGVGMLLAGGCASSTLWRTGEGHTKLFVTLISFALTNAVSFKTLSESGVMEKLGKGVFLPGIVSWYLTIPIFMGFLLLWVVTAIWNEKTDKLVIF